MDGIDYRENIDRLFERINESCILSSRNPDDIKIIAVSKTQESSAVKRVSSLGLLDFGENKAQELISKYDELIDENLSWHFIGQIQTNKLKKIASRVSLIQSIDNTKQLDLLSKLEKKPDLLIQLSSDGDPSRGGVVYDSFEPILNYAHNCELNVVGVMHVPPPNVDPRSHFDMARKCAESFDLKIISMGMSGDFEVAIEHGSTMVRIGSTIFGSRIYD